MKGAGEQGSPHPGGATKARQPRSPRAKRAGDVRGERTPEVKPPCTMDGCPHTSMPTCRTGGSQAEGSRLSRHGVRTRPAQRAGDTSRASGNGQQQFALQYARASLHARAQLLPPCEPLHTHCLAAG